MKRLTLLFCVLLALVASLGAKEKVVKLKIVQTSDIHGDFYSHNFLSHQSTRGGLARISSFVKEARQCYGDRLLLFDNGDLLQGQPDAYYYNYMDTVAPHLAAEMLNYMGYNVANMGNHDVETGRRVFERYAADCHFPLLGANIVDTHTGQPFFPPYAVFVRQGVKVVVLGMITPAIPVWLPENLWQGLRFDDMEETARKWMEIIRRKEQPDVVVGLFHAGRKAQMLGGQYREDASEEVATRVPGFDVVLVGHDHQRDCKVLTTAQGDSVWLLDPASNGLVVSEVDLTLKLRHGKVTDKQVDARLTSVSDYEPDADFLSRFDAQRKEVEGFISEKIGYMGTTITTRDAYFGSSAFVDLIHKLQLAISGAQISMASPLSFDVSICEGDIRVSDMFNLYKYENLLYVMQLTGKEIRQLLEMSYDLWTVQMQSPDDRLLKLTSSSWDGQKRLSFQNYSFNFDSAAGIIYTVDVTKPRGEKIHIERMADGSPFSEEQTYRVALNSYRGNGGGDLLTQGAGIAQDKLKERIVWSTDKDLRYYLMQYIRQNGLSDLSPLDNWKFVPEEWVQPASKRDYRLLFGE